jgi:hypothetical protein
VRFDAHDADIEIVDALFSTSISIAIAVVIAVAVAAVVTACSGSGSDSGSGSGSGSGRSGSSNRVGGIVDGVVSAWHDKHVSRSRQCNLFSAQRTTNTAANAAAARDIVAEVHSRIGVCRRKQCI